MTEQHECEWRILLVMPNSATAQIRIRCRICNEPLLRQNAEAMLNEYEKRKRATEALAQTVGFFASVIKSGEPWTEACEKAYAHILDWK